MTATITTDASFYYEYKIGGYAYWITTEKKRIIKAGILKGDVSTAFECEFKCILKGLHALKKAGFPHISTIYINTDSLTTINAIEAEKPHKWAKELVEIFHKLRKDIGATIFIRHVKAHDHTDTPRNWVNDWCDKNAKQQARKEIYKRFGKEFGKKKK